MKAIQAIEHFRKELRTFGAEQFGTDNMRTVKACIEASSALIELMREMQYEALQSADWPSQRTISDDR